MTAPRTLMTVPRTLLSLALGLGILTAASGALAATATGTLTVNALVANTCTVANALLDFGTYNPVVGSTAATTTNVNCTLLVPYTVSLGLGDNHSASSNRMKATVAGVDRFIPYTATLTLATGVGTGLNVPTAITGLAAAGANVPAGAYTDSVVVTVTF